jgi:hypothetical protein
VAVLTLIALSAVGYLALSYLAMFLSWTFGGGDLSPWPDLLIGPDFSCSHARQEGPC